MELVFLGAESRFLLGVARERFLTGNLCVGSEERGRGEGEHKDTTTAGATFPFPP